MSTGSSFAGSYSGIHESENECGGTSLDKFYEDPATSGKNERKNKKNRTTNERTRG